MGVVWAGQHVQQKLPVAVKLITAHGAGDPRFVDALRDEVRAVARLDHPGIVHILDQGTVSADDHRRYGGDLPLGSPWLAMELASGGCLSDRGRPLTWSGMKSLLAELLAALGHAHARGLVHRDLKPANVLVAGDADLRPGLKLTDFGIAHAASRFDADRSGDRETIVGTPRHMAPEQFRGSWRDYGPWTDLYALGAIAWELATGQPPFPGHDVVRLAFMHLNSQPVRPAGDLPVPEGFWPWVQTLLRKDPSSHFRRAADAAEQLAAIVEAGAPDADRTLSWRLGGGLGTTVDLSADASFAPTAEVDGTEADYAAPALPLGADGFRAWMVCP
ncbi:MAG: serine/threonine protein kinase [Proteobacteria bacterium]|nr:serine/threonine protein kinase [Pseudomonadota bacterium]